MNKRIFLEKWATFSPKSFVRKFISYLLIFKAMQVGTLFLTFCCCYCTQAGTSGKWQLEFKTCRLLTRLTTLTWKRFCDVNFKAYSSNLQIYIHKLCYLCSCYYILNVTQTPLCCYHYYLICSCHRKTSKVWPRLQGTHSRQKQVCSSHMFPAQYCKFRASVQHTIKIKHTEIKCVYALHCGTVCNEIIPWKI